MAHLNFIARSVTFVISALALASSQSNTNLVFDLLEEQKADTLVGDVAQASGLWSQIASADVQRLRYEILVSDSPGTTSMFTINSSTGTIYTNAMIDREHVCESASMKCELEFDVAVKLEAAAIKILHVVVIILDINDNPPTFPKKDLQLSISEASPKGSDYSISGAIDKDAQPDAVIIYWLADNVFFGLREEKLMGVSLLKIVLLQELDREKQNEHQVVLYAKDGNTSSALTGTLAVTIIVTDVNDNNPHFAKSAFNFTVSEDADVGIRIGTVEASDSDAGDNGRIAFMFSPLTSNKFRQLFELDIQTGNVTVKSSLQYESGESFRAVVIAKDHGESEKASQTILFINVLDAGNTPPKVSLILAGPIFQNSIVLSEDLPVGSFVGRLRYQDNDEGDNGVVECMSLDPHFIFVSPEENSITIDVGAPLDREANSEMMVVLKCSDLGTPSLTTFVNFTVRLSDVNDNNPVFERVDYTGRVKENERLRQNIVQVSATDKDEGVNRELTYHLTMNTSSSFTVNPFTGWISMTSPLDREIEPTIRLTVEAVDKGKPPLTGSVVVTIHVDDVNDHEPQITRTDYQVKENEEPGSFVAQIIASDNDLGPNADLTFLLLSDPSASFQVSGKGIISTTKKFDREAVDLYKILVSVNDKGTPSLSSTSTITISISDANDHSPQFLYPRPGNDSLTLSANHSPGTVFATANATDMDLNKNAQLIYLIAEGNPRQIFGIDNSTGSIYLAKRLTTRRDTNYRLTISVQDGGNPRLHNSTFLFITIDFRNVSMTDTAADQQQKFVIIAGVIAGITLVVAVTVVAIILQLKRTDPRRQSGPAPKFKDTSLTNTNCQRACQVSVQQMSKLKISSPVLEMRSSGTKNPGHNLSPSVGGHLFGGNTPVASGLTLTRGTLEHLNSPQLSRLHQGRQPAISEDIHSDSSGEATASDSGRGSSDVDYISSGASLNSGSSPAKLSTPHLPPKGQALTRISSSSEQARPVFARDSLSLGDLSGAARTYASQKDSDRMGRTIGRVRFSFDDHNIHNPRLGRYQPRLDQQVSPGQQMSNSSSRLCQKSPADDIQKRLHANGDSLSENNHASQFQEWTPTSVNHIDPNSTRQFSPVSSFLLSKDALLKHNRLQSGSKQQQQSYTKHSLLLPHINPYHHNQHLGPLVALHLSGDEDDDDMSTTTSGSYAVEGVDDTVSASVDS